MKVTCSINMNYCCIVVINQTKSSLIEKKYDE